MRDAKRMFDIEAFCWLRLFDNRTRRMYWHNGFTHVETWSEPLERGRVNNRFEGYSNEDVWEKVQHYHPQLTAAVRIQKSVRFVDSIRSFMCVGLFV